MAIPDFASEKTYFDGFHCWENASTEVATPMSPNAAARASEAISKKGTPVVITLESLSLGITVVCPNVKFEIKSTSTELSERRCLKVDVIISNILILV